VLVQDLADDPGAVVGRADVALVDGDAVVGILVTELPGGLGVRRLAGRDRNAAVDQPLADREAETAGAAGYQRDLPAHVRHGITSISW
jgi:hypothetical protein